MEKIKIILDESVRLKKIGAKYSDITNLVRRFNLTEDIDEESYKAFVNNFVEICFNSSIDYKSFSIKKFKSKIKPTSEKKLEQDRIVKTGLDAEESEREIVNKLFRAYEKGFSNYLRCLVFHYAPNMLSYEVSFAVITDDNINESVISDKFGTTNIFNKNTFSLSDLDPKRRWIICTLFLDDYSLPEWVKDWISDKITDIRSLDISQYYRKSDVQWVKEVQDLKEIFCNKERTLFVDQSLSPTEISVLKSFFSRRGCHLLYQVLKGGNSGSKVVSVTALPKEGHNRKTVFKIESNVPSGVKSKVEEERDLCESYVKNYYIDGQNIDTQYKNILGLHILQYPYASEDGVRSSKSYSEDYVGMDVLSQIQDRIDTIFSHSAFKNWKKIDKRKTCSVGDFYSDFLKVDKSVEKMKIISKLNGVDKLPDYQSVLNLAVNNPLVKICHGDLHSDNIHVDGGKIFLIDFGYTGKHPIYVDYVALETSFRFKLLSPIIDHNVILKAEEGYGNLFQAQSGVPNCSNPVEKLMASISLIRSKFLEDFQDCGIDRTELIRQYEIALYCFCLRQVCYPDLRQLYIFDYLKKLEPIILNG